MPSSCRMVRRHPVESSSIRAIGYDRRTRELWVEYRTRYTPYAYVGVPPYVFAELQSAESKGGFVNRVIKPRYPFERRHWPS